jgi:hypothetical protein
MSLHYYTQLDLEKEGGLDVMLLSSVLVTVLLVALLIQQQCWVTGYMSGPGLATPYWL